MNTSQHQRDTENILNGNWRCFSITGRGTVATGRIERNPKLVIVLKLLVLVYTNNNNYGIEMFQKTLDEGLRVITLVFYYGVTRENIERGMVLRCQVHYSTYSFESEVMF
jgi:translation elongation factor EF-Tu-like GTPase